MGENEHTDIKLVKAIKVGGTMVTALRMREPTVADQLAMEKGGGTPAEQEIRLVSNLCMVSPDEIGQLSLKDYKKVQAALSAFTV